MKRLSILIADRTPEFCVQLARWLPDHDTTCVHSPAEAMSAAVLLHFDVMVTAFSRDDASSLEEIRALKRRQPWARVLAVVPDAWGDNEQRELSRALCSGADAAVPRTLGERQFRVALRACWHDVPAWTERSLIHPRFSLSRA